MCTVSDYTLSQRSLIIGRAPACPIEYGTSWYAALGPAAVVARLAVAADPWGRPYHP